MKGSAVIHDLTRKIPVPVATKSLSCGAAVEPVETRRAALQTCWVGVPGRSSRAGGASYCVSRAIPTAGARARTNPEGGEGMPPSPRRGSCVCIPPTTVLIALVQPPAARRRVGRCPAPIREAVRRGHKVACAPIREGESAVALTAQVTGPRRADRDRARRPRPKNLAIEGAPARASLRPPTSRPSRGRDARGRSRGFHRDDGRRSGTAQLHAASLTSVNCSGSGGALHCGSRGGGPQSSVGFGNVDGVCQIVHAPAAKLSRQGDEGSTPSYRTFEGYAQNPNFGGILLGRLLG